MAVYISIAAGAININTLNRGSVISIGEVSQPGWTQNGKTNFGSGQLFGSNLSSNYLSNLYDHDFLDNPIAGFEPATSFQNKVI